jgi:hypothetical protein
MIYCWRVFPMLRIQQSSYIIFFYSIPTNNSARTASQSATLHRSAKTASGSALAFNHRINLSLWPVETACKISLVLHNV